MTDADRTRQLELKHAYNQGRIDALRELADGWARRATEATEPRLR